MDVYAISTGAMFSSGFFLLPGLAAAQTGPSVALAYVVAGLFIVPPMLCVAELATAMPRAGGAYYFLDRALGPWVGTVGGLGTWMALVLKSAFALVGMGAYLALYFDVPIQPLAVALTVAFMVVNILGAKETTGLQRVLVGALLVVMVLFMVAGLGELSRRGFAAVTGERLTPFMPFGVGAFFSTVGFVFVSYAGLTKVASVSEEVMNPDRNIPLGMILSLLTAAVTYGVGVFIMVAVLPPEQLRADLTPVASAAGAIGELSGEAGKALVVVAALAAFASTGNAGILSASRYPLAMARDRLVPEVFGKLGRFRTPTVAVATTSTVIALAIVALPVESIAKLASAFQLLLFSLLSLAVVIMRESGIDGYDPGYRSPFYPWLHLTGFLAPLWLIAEMGQGAMIFTLGLVAFTTIWFFKYAAPRVERAGAIFHTFARLGERRTTSLDTELRHIVREKGLREGDPFRELVARAQVLDLPDPLPVEELFAGAARLLAPMAGADAELIRTKLEEEFAAGFMPVGRGVALPHLRLPDLPEPLLLLVRCRRGLMGRGGGQGGGSDEAAGPLEDLTGVRAVMFLMSPEGEHGQHLRMLGHLASVAEREDFLARWETAPDETELRALLLDGEEVVTLIAGPGGTLADWIGRPLREIDVPQGVLVAVIHRNGSLLIPHGGTCIEPGDAVTLIGEVRRVGRTGSV